MPHWLYKSEPFKWSWDQQVAAGAKGTYWDGVRNHSAKLNLKAMRVGDQGFFYHSNEGLEVVGIVDALLNGWVTVDGALEALLSRPQKAE